MIFIACHCLTDETQNPPAVKRVCAATKSTAMQLDEEEESKFKGWITTHCIPSNVNWIHLPEEILVTGEVQAFFVSV